MAKTNPRIKKVPQRSCVGCRVKKDKSQLIRVVRTPEGRLEVDLKGKSSGRGAYICPDTECLQKAVKNKGLNRALGVQLDDDLLVELTNQVKKHEHKS